MLLWIRISGAALALLLALSLTLGASAKTIRHQGVVFSEGSANMRLVSVTGRGTLRSPFIVVEEVFGDGEAVLEIEILRIDFGSRIDTAHAMGFALTKIVINKTDAHWDYFSLELEFTHGDGSDYYDGLSFAQAAVANRPFRSDRFKNVEDIIEPRDVIRFTDGSVAPNERAAFAISITHTGPTPRFLLVQHVKRPYASRRLRRRLARVVPE